MATFIPSLELNERFFKETVRPILAADFPDLRYGAGLIGPGSEVLGFDTPMSMDHDWGLQFFIFVKEEDRDQCQAIANVLSHRLPLEFLGFPVSLTDSAAPPRQRKFDVLAVPLEGPIQHNIVPLTVRQFSNIQLAWDSDAALTTKEWLAIPGYKFGEVVAGQIFCDDTSEITHFRQNLTWYSWDVWLYLLAKGWHRIGEDEHLMPRAGFVGDNLGASLMASRLVRAVMSLCFLIEKKYPPYSKWFGSAFRKLDCGEELMPLLRKVQTAASWQEQHEGLVVVYEYMAKKHNELGITERLPYKASGFHDRPWQVIHGDVFAEALVRRIRREDIKKLGEALVSSDLPEAD